MKPRALVLDDEPLMRDYVSETLRSGGFEVRGYAIPEQALAEWGEFHPDVAFLDLRLPGLSGVEVMRRAREAGGSGSCVMLTAYGTVETAVEALREGAEDYLLKPCSADRIERAAAQALRMGRLRNENLKLREAVQGRRAERILGGDPAIVALLQQIDTLARSRATVLITGESGTGKELVARGLHEQGPRSEGPWVSVNCAAVPESLLESELFGHERGAFTGAASRHVGRFEQAQGGTLLLDEISEIPPVLQAKLLRVLQEREFYRVGGTEPVRVDVRVVATTNRDLAGMMARGEFRTDLYYRLNVVGIHLPPLRDRRGDIGGLAGHFIARVCAEMDRPAMALSPEALRRLEAHAWPGNVRELLNAVERAVVLARGEELGPEDFPLDTSPEVAPASGTLRLEELEREAIGRALELCDGHRERTAAMLGISVRTLRNKLALYRSQGQAPVRILPGGAAEISTVRTNLPGAPEQAAA